MANLNDVCGVCDEYRQDHGDKNHQFNAEGILIPLSPRPEPKNTPPQERRASVAAPSPNAGDIAASFAMLVEVLAEKHVYLGGEMIPLLSSKDIIRIFSANSRG